MNHDDEYTALCASAENLIAQIITQEFSNVGERADVQLHAEQAAERIFSCVEGMIDGFAQRLVAGGYHA